jgi:hypothetical protein
VRVPVRLGLRLGVGLGLEVGAPAGPRGGLVDLVLELLELLVAELLGIGLGLDAVLHHGVGVDVGVGHDLAVGALDQRGLELVDLTGGVLELARQVRAPRLAGRGPGVLRPAGLALLGSLSVSGHDVAPASGSPYGSCARGTTCSICAA